MKYLFFSLILSLYSMSSTAAYVDDQVKTFLNVAPDSARLKVILLFKAEDKGKNINAKVSIDELRNTLNRKASKFVSDMGVLQKKDFTKLWLVSAISISLNKQEIKAVMGSPEVQAVETVDEELVFEPVDAYTVQVIQNSTRAIQQIGVVALRKKYPELLGTGVRVGVTDTGINAKHPVFTNVLHSYKDFSPRPEERPSDPLDHGTHIAGTVAGGVYRGTRIGVAPEADLYFARIFDRNRDMDKHKIIEAFQWMADPDGDPATNDRVRVVNNSWASGRDYSKLKPSDNIYCRGVQTLYELGIISVFAAGNRGPKDNSVAIPGACPKSISVGSVDPNDRAMYFSGVGPAQWVDQTYKKPDYMAPGLDILSANSGGGLSKMTGTSMSAPHVTGAVALLLQKFPGASVDEIKEALREGARDLGPEGFDPDFGWGRINILSSLEYLEAKFKFKTSQGLKR